MKQLNDYNNALQSIYDYFSFEEGCAVYQIDDCREYFWKTTATEVYFYDTIEAFRNNDGDHSYSNKILYLHSYPKAVYEGPEFTLIIVDTHTDGNRFFAIYDNSKRIL